MDFNPLLNSRAFTREQAESLIRLLEATRGALPRVTGAPVPGKRLVITGALTLDKGLEEGTYFSIYNDSGAGVTLTQGAGLTLRHAGTATTGSLTLAQRGVATVWANSAAEYIVEGDVS